MNLPGITSSWTRNPPEEWLFLRELPACGRGNLLEGGLFRRALPAHRLGIYPHEIKGIVSRDFGSLFLISLDSFEGPNRAGAGLFFILMTFSCLNFKKLGLCGKDLSE
jgi:hypothetical protein